MSFLSSFEIVLYQNHAFFFRIPASIAEAAAVVVNEAKIFFLKGTATFITWPAILLKNDPENP